MLRILSVLFGWPQFSARERAVSKESAIYHLGCSSDPRFRCLTYKATKSFFGNKFPIEDWDTLDDAHGGWLPPPLVKLWTPQPVGGDVPPFVDYPTLELATPAFSPRAVQALRQLLEAGGELLEVRHKNGPYFALIVTKQTEALDVRKAEIRWFSDAVRVRARDIKRFEFTKSKLHGLSIFSLKQTPRFTLVTEQFKQRVEAAGLNGFAFTKVWPLPPRVYWRDAQIEARRSAKKKLGLFGESLILRFRPKSERPTPKEKKRIRNYAAELNSLLTNQQAISDPYYGTVESVEFVDGDCRIFLSCPTVEALIMYLIEWIQSNDWPGEFHIVKRLGNLFDTKAKEISVVIR
jgi:hypothetical protein